MTPDIDLDTMSSGERTECAAAADINALTSRGHNADTLSCSWLDLLQTTFLKIKETCQLMYQVFQVVVCLNILLFQALEAHAHVLARLREWNVGNTSR